MEMIPALSFTKLLILIFLIVITATTEIQHWEMSRQCGSTIGRGYLFGEVTFHPGMTGRQMVTNSCVVYIKPKKFKPSKTNGIVVYFTEFDLGDDCKRGRLTMYDTNDKNLVKYSRAGMCGRNYTLTDRSAVFIVEHGTLILNYTWTSGNFDANSHEFQPAFTLKFNSFYKYTSPHECRGSDRHSCVTAPRCIPVDTNCKGQYQNGCGYTAPERCDGIIDVKEPNFLEIVGQLLVAIVIIAIGYGTYQCFKNGRSILAIGCRGREGRSTTHDEDSTPYTNVQTNDSNMQETELTTEHNISERSDLPTGSNLHEYEYNLPHNALSPDLPPSYDDLDSSPHHSSGYDIERRSPPPPSYDEFQTQARLLTEYNSIHEGICDSPSRSSGHMNELGFQATLLPSVSPPPYDGMENPPCFTSEYNIREQSDSSIRSSELGDEYNECTSNHSSCASSSTPTPPPTYYVSGRRSQCIHQEV